jgi:hypothetical protein
MARSDSQASSMSLAGAAKTLGSNPIFLLSAYTFAVGMCPVDEVILRGRVDRPPDRTKVRVQLVYAKDVPGASGDTTLEDEKFSLPLEFLTESRKPLINGAFGKCGRRPTTVIVTLLDSGGSQEYDRVVLHFARDFEMVGPTTYGLRSEVLLKGPQ